MAKKRKHIAPRYTELMQPTFDALRQMGGSGTNVEICNAIIKNLQLADDVINEMHPGSTVQTELEYQLAWARTYLKKYGAISNSGRSVWAITPEFLQKENIDSKDVDKTVRSLSRIGTNTEVSDNSDTDDSPAGEGVESEEIRPWKENLSKVLMNMDPFGFERLTQRLLRECGFTQVVVTRKTGDGGIDGTGKLKINGIFSFNVAFQCKRYSGAVGAPEIRDFRGSLTTDIEKGIFITTGTFTKAAIEEASNAGKQQIDLISGEEFMNKLAEYEIGLKEIKDYEIDEEFFRKI